MKSSLHLALMFALTSFFSSVAAQTITIPDPALNAAVRAALQKPTGPLVNMKGHQPASLTAPPAPQPHLSSFQKTVDGAFAFDLIGPPGHYTIFTSPDLLTWNVAGTLNNSSGTARFTDPAAFLSSQKFYRATLQGAPPNMVLIQPNTFKMGSPNNEQDRNTNEGPQTTVTLTHAFWIGQYEVTQQEFLAVTGTNPSVFPGDPSRPVSSVSWFGATDYCTKLTQQELAAGRIPTGAQYRLPTEAEWECAARAGTSTRFSYGDDPSYSSLANFAWFSQNAGAIVHPVGQKLPNPWGLYDMAGNVWEWCQDWFDTLPGGAQTDPSGPASSLTGLKVMRGGAYDFGNTDCRSARRNFFGANPFLTDSDLGFRVVLTTVP